MREFLRAAWFGTPQIPDIYAFSIKKPGGGEQSLADYKGRVLLVVNVASGCGFTPQYEGLESLAKKYRDKGLIVIGFPCNQFGGQESGSDQEIQSFCKMNFGVSFAVMAKIEVNGEGADPLFAWLKTAAPGVLGTLAIKWNFTKFLIGRDGRAIARYAPRTQPKKLERDIEKALGI